MDAARKNDQGKLRYDLIPPGPLRELAWVYTMGAKKYGDNNWQNGLARERIVAALMRHMEQYRTGEQRDQEDGQLHLSSVAWCAFALMWYDMQKERACKAADDGHQKHMDLARRTWGADIDRTLREATFSNDHDEVAKELDRTGYRGRACPSSVGGRMVD